MNVEYSVLFTQRPTRTATDHDRFREQSVQTFDESVQVVEELIGQVIHDNRRLVSRWFSTEVTV